MSLGLYLDDCAYRKLLRHVLASEPYNHRVVIPQDAGLAGAADEAHFAYVRSHSLCIVTKNPADFEALHYQYADHPGVFAIYQDNDQRDMSEGEVAQAIQNILDAGVPIAGGFHVLNHWRY